MNGHARTLVPPGWVGALLGALLVLVAASAGTFASFRASTGSAGNSFGSSTSFPSFRPTDRSLNWNTEEYADTPSITVVTYGGTSTPYVAWKETSSSGDTLFVRRYDAATGTWSRVGGQINTAGATTETPNVVASGSVLWIVWVETVSGVATIRVASNDLAGGAGWSTPSSLNAAPTRNAYRPAITISSGNPWVTWIERTAAGNFQIQSRRASGTTWQPAVAISPVSKDAQDPVITSFAAPSSGRGTAGVYLAYSENTSVSGTVSTAPYALKAVTSTDGVTWTAAGTVLSTAGVSAFRASLNGSSGTLRAAWKEFSDAASTCFQIRTSYWDGTTWVASTGSTGPYTTATGGTGANGPVTVGCAQKAAWTGGDTNSGDPVLTDVQGVPWLTYLEYAGSAQQVFVKSYPGSETAAWTNRTPTGATSTGPSSWNYDAGKFSRSAVIASGPSPVAGKTRIWVTWVESNDNTNGVWQVRMRFVDV